MDRIVVWFWRKSLLYYTVIDFHFLIYGVFFDSLNPSQFWLIWLECSWALQEMKDIYEMNTLFKIVKISNYLIYRSFRCFHLLWVGEWRALDKEVWICTVLINKVSYLQEFLFSFSNVIMKCHNLKKKCYFLWLPIYLV